MKKGFSLIELLVAVLIAGLVIGFAVAMLRDQNSNMIHVRSRVQSQTAARDGMKIMESELRAAGFGVQLAYANPGTAPLEITSLLPTCPALIDAPTGSSVIAMDGEDGGNDTLDLAFPAAVNGSFGTDCLTAQWSRYLVTGSDLMRYSATTRADLEFSIPTVVGRNVDVFQIQPSVTGISQAGRLFLGADSCCSTTGAATWTPSTNVTPSVDATTNINTLTIGSGTWKYMSLTKALFAGETWRVHVTVDQANSDLIADLTANPGSAFVKFGIYDAADAEVAVVGLLSRPTMATYGFGLSTEADLVVPAAGTYRLGISGKASNSLGNISIRSFDALSVRRGTDSAWLRNPNATEMLPGDWTRVKALRVQILTRAPADKREYHTLFTDLANFKQKIPSPPSVGEFEVRDSAVRVLLDHQYPAGNNGKF